MLAASGCQNSGAKEEKAVTETTERETAEEGTTAASSAEETAAETLTPEDACGPEETGADGKTVSEYLTEVKESRKKVRERNKEASELIINDSNRSEEERQAEADNLAKVTGVAEKEEAAEELLMAKNFADAVVSIHDGGIDVVINGRVLTEQREAQLRDIIRRKCEIDPSETKINITLMNESGGVRVSE